MKIGKFDVHLISDGTFALDGGQMFGVVPKVLWEKKMAPDSLNRIRLGLTCLLVQAGGRNILIESGIGDKFDSKFGNIYAVQRQGTLLDRLAELGVRPADVHLVINSHLHFDHCGWNTRREGGRTMPTFRDSRYIIQRGEWEHAMHPSERDHASYMPEFFEPAAALTDLVDGNQEIFPGIRVEVLPGHARHLQGVWVESEGESLLFISDLTPTRAHVPHPWIMAFDLYPMETLETKKRLFPELVERKTWVVFPHDHQNPCTQFELREGKIVPGQSPQQR
jgi:glyoxylase-like metal-dependent hydrolase (beta-lactamase superfamily II)